MATRRHLIVQSAVLALLSGTALQVGAAATAPTPRAKTEPPPPEARVRIVTYNTAATQRTAPAVADIVRLATETEADVLTLQEMSGAARRKGVREALVDCSMCSYEEFMPQPAVPGGTPLLYRWERFRFLEAGSKRVTKDTYVGPRGAGPDTLRARYVNWVRLRERATGQDLVVLNNHAVPTVQASQGGPNKNRERVRMYRRHMKGLQALVRSFRDRGDVVFVTGDMNVNYRKDKIVRAAVFPYARMKAVGLDASFESLWEPAPGTHVLRNGFDKRQIDYVYSPPAHPWVTPVGHEILLDHSSDHRPVVVDYRFAPPTVATSSAP